MDSELVQRTRYQLQTRVRHAKTCPAVLFPAACKHLLRWIEEHPLLATLAAPLAEDVTTFEARIAADLAKLNTPSVREITGPWDCETREKAIALGIAGLRSIAECDFTDQRDRSGYIVALVTSGYNPRDGVTAEGVTDAVRDVCLQGFYEYLDEQIDGRNAVLGLLSKYKTRCEMYRRGRLRDASGAIRKDVRGSALSPSTSTSTCTIRASTSPSRRCQRQVSPTSCHIIRTDVA